MAGVSPGAVDRFPVDARDAFIKFWSTWHAAVHRVTEGQVLGRVLGMTVVRLTTTGRRSGRPRTTMLTAPIVEDGKIVVVASNGGDDRDPQWYRNLVACPRVSVTVGGVTSEMDGRTAVGSERADLWDRICDLAPTYQHYQDRTRRRLPLVVLEPVSGDTTPRRAPGQATSPVVHSWSPPGR